MPDYIAIIGDLKKSRSINDRANAQRMIKRTLNDIYVKHSHLFASRISLTLGDEFQSLIYPNSKGIFFMIDDLESHLSDFPFRIGIGYGNISTDIDNNLSTDADGEAFWNAREAITTLRTHESNRKVKIYIKGFTEHQDEILNGLLEASDTLKSSWTTLQKQTFYTMIAQGIYSPKFNQKNHAQIIGISESSYTKRLYASNIKLYLRLRNLIEESMGRWYQC